MENLDEEADRALRSAGWMPGRRIDVAGWRVALLRSGFPVHRAAEEFLAEFGGLSFDDMGPGVSRAREALVFDPLLAIGEEDRFAAWGKRIDRELCPIGELDGGRFFLAIDEDGMIYLVADWVGRFGIGRDGVDHLVVGIAPDKS